MTCSIGILPRLEADRELSEIWAARLDLPLLEAGEPTSVKDPTIVVQVSGGEASLCLTGPGAPGPLAVDFTSAKLFRRVRQGLSQSLARACGLRAGRRPSILDATAGLGRDAYVLAALGSEVTMVERDPVLHLLLELALQRLSGCSSEAQRGDLRLELHLDEGRRFMLAEDFLVPDVIYLDPMFPPRRKSARVKKEMQLLHAMLGDPPTGDAESLLQEALRKARQRVVVKRPRISPPLGGKKPHQSFVGRSHRYDLYLVPTVGSRD